MLVDDNAGHPLNVRLIAARDKCFLFHYRKDQSGQMWGWPMLSDYPLE